MGVCAENDGWVFVPRMAGGFVPRMAGGFVPRLTDVCAGGLLAVCALRVLFWACASAGSWRVRAGNRPRETIHGRLSFSG